MILSPDELRLIQQGLKVLIEEERVEHLARAQAIKNRVDLEIADMALPTTEKLNRDENDELWA